MYSIIIILFYFLIREKFNRKNIECLFQNYSSGLDERYPERRMENETLIEITKISNYFEKKKLYDKLKNNKIPESVKLELIDNYNKSNEIKPFTFKSGGLFKDFDFDFLYYYDFI
jgi:hypothetical protein